MNDRSASPLAHQSLGRPLSTAERELATQLGQVFATGTHDFDAVAAALQQRSVARPSGESGPWSAAVLQQELSTINASLDAAYAEHGIGA